MCDPGKETRSKHDENKGSYQEELRGETHNLKPTPSISFLLLLTL